jgi:antitoxin CcdA
MLQTTANKKATNVSVNAALLQQAKAFNINLSSTLEQALIAKLKQLQADTWATENKTAISAYNRHIEQNGVFGDDVRAF